MIWTAVYQFWAHLILEPKLGKPGEKISSESKQRCFLYILFFFGIPKRRTTFIWNERHINKSFDSQSWFCRETDWQIQPSSTKTTLFKQEIYFSEYCCPNYLPRIGPARGMTYHGLILKCLNLTDSFMAKKFHFYHFKMIHPKIFHSFWTICSQ